MRVHLIAEAALAYRDASLVSIPATCCDKCSVEHHLPRRLCQLHQPQTQAERRSRLDHTPLKPRSPKVTITVASGAANPLICFKFLQDPRHEEPLSCRYIPTGSDSPPHA